MDRSTATLIAAVIAAISSIISIFARRASEMRKAHRDTLEPHIQDLAKAIHEAVATSNIIVMTSSEEARANWREKGNRAKDKLKELRIKLRYSLWGLDTAIKEIALLPNWVEHAWDYPDYRDGIIERGDELSDALDFSIRRCYRKGRTPAWYERVYVENKRKKLKSYYDEFQEVKQKDLAERHSP